ncbi:MAG: sugar phosphate isomerase/epimerase [Oscillospiraceae bacterium]|nr:sugar phosphate isomerase/epimerase [Oscillospiraceae bacterium]
MKIGLSSYSLLGAMRRGEMDFLGIMQWIADNGGDHMEAVSMMGDFLGDASFVRSVAEKSKAIGLPIAAYCTGVNLLDKDDPQAQLELAMRHADIAAELGAGLMRCDLVGWSIPKEELTAENFDRDLPVIIEGAGKIADYAARLGLTITVENHGMYLNGGERVRRLIKGVNRENYKCSLDIGNSLCVDEDPIVCVDALLPFAATVHFKDFYIRRADTAPGEGFGIKTPRDYLLRGAIVGHGEVDVRRIMGIIKKSGYSGSVSIEFEGMEDCKLGSKLGMENTRRLAEMNI